MAHRATELLALALGVAGGHASAARGENGADEGSQTGVPPLLVALLCVGAVSLFVFGGGKKPASGMRLGSSGAQQQGSRDVRSSPHPLASQKEQKLEETQAGGTGEQEGSAGQGLRSRGSHEKREPANTSLPDSASLKKSKQSEISPGRQVPEGASEAASEPPVPAAADAEANTRETEGLGGIMASESKDNDEADLNSGREPDIAAGSSAAASGTSSAWAVVEPAAAEDPAGGPRGSSGSVENVTNRTEPLPIAASPGAGSEKSREVQDRSSSSCSGDATSRVVLPPRAASAASVTVKEVVSGEWIEVMLSAGATGREDRNVETLSALRTAIAAQRPAWAQYELVVNGRKLPHATDSNSAGMKLSALGVSPGVTVMSVAGGRRSEQPVEEKALKAALVAATRAAPGIRELLITVVGNLLRHGDEPKFRQINDGAVRKRCVMGGYDEALAAMKQLGFILESSDATSRWVFTGDLDAAYHRLGEAERLLSVMQGLAPVASPMAPQEPQSSRGDLGCSVLVVPRGNGLPSLRILAFPADYFELVPPQDAETWARFSGSRKGRNTMRRPVDDRAMLTLCSCTQLIVTATWVNFGGQENERPNIVSAPHRPGTIETWVGHSFLLRSQPNNLLCGLRIIERPPHMNGHLVVLVTDAAEERLEGFAEQCRQILGQLRDDQREPPEQTQGRGAAPPPPNSRNCRGPWG